MTPVKRTTTVTMLGVDSESSSLKKHRVLAFAASGMTVSYTINAAEGSSDGNYSATNDKSPMSDCNTLEIGKDLHSRQLAGYGRDTIFLLFSLKNVLVFGLQGLGAEIAKNLILSGVISVNLHHDGYVEWDLSSSFIFSQQDFGKNKALATVPKLQELNNSIRKDIE